jgi:putative phosphoribosyl transferase
MMPFRDRSEAGRRLAKALAAYKAQKPVILALPRGGVPVAAEVAAVLDAPLDLILVRKIGAPMQPELAIAAVVDGGQPIIVRNEDVIQLAEVSEAEFEVMCAAELTEIERRRGRYLGDRARVEVGGRVTIVIDDGIATGATTRAALRATRVRNPQKLVLAIPVGATAVLIEMRQEADDVICLEAYERLRAIGWFYEDFTQVADEQVIAALARSAPTTAVKKPAA